MKGLALAEAKKNNQRAWFGNAGMAISEIKDALTNPNVFFSRGTCVFKRKKSESKKPPARGAKYVAKNVLDVETLQPERLSK